MLLSEQIKLRKYIEKTNLCSSVIDILLLKTYRLPEGYLAMPRGPTSVDLVAGGNKVLSWSHEKNILGPTHRWMRCSGKIYWSKNKELSPDDRCLIPDWMVQLCSTVDVVQPLGPQICLYSHQAQCDQGPAELFCVSFSEVSIVQLSLYSPPASIASVPGCTLVAHSCARPTGMLWRGSTGTKEQTHR